MYRILKWGLDYTENTQRLLMPPIVEILHVGQQGGALCMWILHDMVENAQKPLVETHKFKVFGTGQLISDEKKEYLGSVQVKDLACYEYVWHIFKVEIE